MTLEMYKGVWALSTADKKSGRLKAVNIAYPIVYGAQPVWIVATIEGRFLRFAASRAMIENAYPKLVWRRTMWRWSLRDRENHPIPKRLDEVEQLYKAKVGARS